MILKIRTLEGWRYISNVKDVITELSTIARVNSVTRNNPSQAQVKRQINESILISHHWHGEPENAFHNLVRDDKSINIKEEDDEVVFVAALINGERVVYLCDNDVYFLSDEGKTIERIS